MKNFLLGVLAVLIVAGGIYAVRAWRTEKFGSLQVLVTSSDRPLGNLEVDIKKGRQPGQPDFSGQTDDDGTISFFSIPSGQYVIYFNQNGFPENLDYGKIPLFYATVKDGGTAKQIIDIPGK